MLDGKVAKNNHQPLEIVRNDFLKINDKNMDIKIVFTSTELLIRNTSIESIISQQANLQCSFSC